MDSLDPLPPSVLRDRLSALADLYARADAAVDDFVRASGLGCPFGCGSCCEGFVPDILPIEADFVALQLARQDRTEAFRVAAQGLSPRRFEGGRTGCPLYRADTPFHCGTYANRPLICRMYAFSAVRDKRGQAEFSLCRLMPAAAGMSRSGTGENLASRFGASPPVMADYGSELAGIDPGSAGERGPIHELLARAVTRVLFLAGMGSDPENDGPTVSPPVPNAS